MLHKKFELLLLASVSMSGFGTAQAADEEKAIALEEIVVTAQKRAESLQDVAVSMVATTGSDIREMAITKAEDLSAIVPGITIAQNPIGNFVFIRGIGTPGANQGIEQSVSIFHDGIYMGRHQLSRAPFMDIERVEVLRGPQSIMFGKNTIGGAVHVITAAPTEEFEASVSGLYGSHGETEFNGVVSGPLSSKVRGRLSFRKYDMDGYVQNVMTGEDGPARDDWTIRGQLVLDTSDTLTIKAKWETSKFEQGEQFTQLATINPLTPGAAAVNGLNKALVAAATGGSGAESYDLERAVINDGGVLVGQLVPAFAGLPGFPDLAESSDNKMHLGTLTLDWSLGEHVLTAVSGYAKYNYRDICDCDFSALPLIQVDAAEKYEQYSQEVRLTSPTGRTVEYIVGAYYHHSDLTFTSAESFGSTLAYGQVGVPTPLLVPNLSRDYVFDQTQEQIAVFGSATWNVTDTTRFSVGLRYFDEKKVADHILNKRFTGGWDYSALAGLPAGTLAYGDTAADYDTFLTTFGAADIGAGPITPGFLTEVIYASLLGTYEHEIRDRKRKESDVNWTITLEHDLTDTAMAYATVATGTKGGGFDARFLRQSDNPFFEYDEEKATNYEVGVKSELFDNRVRLNLAVFQTNIKDFQVSIFDGATAFFVENAAKVRSKGVEMDAVWAVSENLKLNASATYLDAKYRSFPNAPCWATTPAENRGGCVNTGTPSAYRDASGDRLNFAPKFSANLRLDYDRPVSEGLRVRVGSNLYYSDGYFNAADLDPIYARQKNFAKLDVRVAIAAIDDAWEVALIGKNLTDQLTSANNNDQPLVPGNGFAQTDRPRSFAIQARLSF